MVMISWTKEKGSDIKYKVEQKDRLCIIYVKQGDQIMTETYTCEFPTVFGYDAFDMAKIDAILDKMITQAKGGNQ